MIRPIQDRVVRPLFGAVIAPIRAFFALEAASGLLLLFCAAGALAWVNLGGATSYRTLFDLPIAVSLGTSSASFTLHEAINDGFMTIFFALVGMEIKRELVLGELRTVAQAALPAIAALGGMLVPAAIYFAFNRAGPGRAGWGIPMATDIAFCIGVLTLLRARVAHGLVVFVTALAIFDDIGGILVIAFFYGSGLHATWLLGAVGVTAALVIAGRAHVGNGLVYVALGGLLWLALHHGGIHSTIAGVVIGLAVPARTRRPPGEAIEELAAHAQALAHGSRDEGLDSAAILGIEERLEELESPLGRYVHLLHPWVAFVVMPAFAVANSGVDLTALEPSQLTGAVTIGTAVALVGGKLVGIFTFTAAAVRVGLAPMPGNATHAKLLGVSAVAGIGFTVALFIASLAFPDSPVLLDEAKVGILAGSLAAGMLGASILSLTRRLESP